MAKLSSGTLEAIRNFGKEGMLTGSGQGMAPVTPAQQFGSGAGRGIKKMLGAVMPGADFRSDFEVYKDDLESATGTKEMLVIQRDYARSIGDTAKALEAQVKIDILEKQEKEEREQKEEKRQTKETVKEMVSVRYENHDDLEDLQNLASKGASFEAIEKVANEPSKAKISDRYKVVGNNIFDTEKEEFLSSPKGDKTSGSLKTVKTLDKDGNPVTVVINDKGEIVSSFALPPEKDSVKLQGIREKAQDEYRKAGARALKAGSLALEFEKLIEKGEEIDSGIKARINENIRTLTGTEDYLSYLRIQVEDLRASSAIANLPPGVASDKDIALVLGATFPTTANPEVLAQWMRGIEKINNATRQFNLDKVSWLDQYGDQKGFVSYNQKKSIEEQHAFIKSQKVKDNATGEITDPITALLKNPTESNKKAFERRYGFSYEQSLKDLEQSKRVLEKLGRSL